MIDFVTRVLFESLPWLLVFCLLGVAVAVGVHRSRRTRATRRGIWITLAICAGLVGLQRLVVTDREAIADVLQALVVAVDDGDIEAMGRHVDADFRLGQRGRQELLDAANRTLQYYEVDGARVTSMEILVAGDGATVTFWVRCDVRGGNSGGQFMLSHWRIHFIRRAESWFMDRIDEGRADMPVGSSGGFDLLSYFRWDRH